MAAKKTIQMLTLVFIGAFCMGAGSGKEHLLTGDTMGTTYHIKIIAPRSDDMAPVQKRIDQRLEQLNQSMSTYRSDSEISRFNKLRPPEQIFAVSTDFLKVMLAADEIYRLTAGAWDATVYPLVSLWGFGQSKAIDAVPSRASIEKALERVGFNHLEVSEQGYVKKRHPDVTVDLGSIAKGYGVDVTARLIQGLGYQHYLVEIGGEVFASGRRQDGNPWKVGVNRPSKDASATEVYKALSLENRAMATSGDYRNYIEIDGRTYSHIIDPRSGYPTNSGVVSASVIAPNCTLADGLATALMVMGPGQGVQLLNSVDKVEGLIIVRQPDGTLVDHWSNGVLRSINKP
ncbi:MAG: FAD:protein FMN transferase [Desulfobacteraceae bacterium]|jgi:thiamine biosynthesis lipoprotein